MFFCAIPGGKSAAAGKLALVEGPGGNQEYENESTFCFQAKKIKFPKGFPQEGGGGQLSFGGSLLYPHTPRTSLKPAKGLRHMSEQAQHSEDDFQEKDAFRPSGKSIGAEPLRTMRRRSRTDRRIDIIRTLAEMLSEPRCDGITTAEIAKRIGLSEAALYRSYASKAEMFEGVLEKIEADLLGVFARIFEDKGASHLGRVCAMVSVMLDYADKNPGLARILSGQVFLREDPRLTERLAQILEKLELHLRTAFRNAALEGEVPADFNASGRANLVMNWVIGRWVRYAMSGFRVHPGGIQLSTIEIFLK